MARDSKPEEVVETQETVATEGAAATVAEAKSDERFKFVTDPTTQLPVKRKEYIVRLFTENKMSRGAIAKHLSEITGKKVAYQIVFAATKGIKGGPDKEAVVETAPAPAATE